MVQPNGLVLINELLDFVESPEYVVYFEFNVEGTDKIEVKNRFDLINAISDELAGKGHILYDFTEVFWSNHPRIGDWKYDVNNDNFSWEYFSLHSGKRYAIQECSYLSDEYKPKVGKIPLELVCFDKIHTKLCWQIARWDKDNDGYYNFQSCGSRLFEDIIDDYDLKIIWNAIHKADDWLNYKNKDGN